MTTSTAPTTQLPIKELMKQRVVFLDGAMGTSLQKYQPTTEDFEGHEGCNDYLCLTHPDWITQVHLNYFLAGSDAVETNTFGSNPVKLDEYGIEDKLVEMNTAAVNCAKAAIATYR
jgi:5-methyltetrahydrofolate--homocysteine methyltransferase